MGYIDLIPTVFRLTMPDLTTGNTYRTQKFNVGNKQCIGVTIKASQALSVAVAYGIVSDTAADAGGAASLPYKTSATSFASNTSTEGGTYHEIAIPPHARQAQLVISNASGSTVSGAVIDAALRVVAFPASGGSGGGSGSVAIADITDWPASVDATEVGYLNGVTGALQSQIDGKQPAATGTPTGSKFLRDDNSWQTLSASAMPAGIDAAKLADGSVSNAELQYINSLASNAQTQISARLPLAGGTMTGDLIIPAANFKPSGSGGTGHFLKQASSGGAISSAAMAASDIANLNHQMSPVTIAASGSFTTIKSLSGISNCAILVYCSNRQFAWLDWDGTTLSFVTGSTFHVISASPNSSQVGWQVSSGNLQAKNGAAVDRTASALLFPQI